MVQKWKWHGEEMTNGDKIRATKTNTELADAILGAVRIGKNYSDSRIGLIKWLSQEDEIPHTLSIRKKPVDGIRHGEVLFEEDTGDYYVFDRKTKNWTKMFSSEV